MKQKLTILGLVFVLLFSAVACSKLQGLGDNSNHITFSMFSAPKGLFNPIVYEDAYDANVLTWCFDALWGYDSKVQISTETGLAEKFEFSKDNKSLTIWLKKGPKWHDGKPITVDDIIYTWECLADPNYKGVRFSNVQMLKGAQEKHDKKAKTISGITRIDDYTVKVDFAKPQANILAELWSTPIPKHVFEKVAVGDFGTADATMKTIVGSGPYKVKEVRPNEYVTLDRNKEYYRGAPKIETIVLKVLSQDVALAAMQKGEIDILSQVSPREVKALRKNEDLAVEEHNEFAYQYMGMNNASPKLEDRRVRQAITYAINRQALVDGLLEGNGYVLNQHEPDKSWAYNESLKNVYPHDVNKAKALLAEAGYKDVNGDGFVEDPQGKPFVLKLDFPTGNPVREDSAPIIAGDLKKAGINVEVGTPREATSHYTNIQQGKSELYLAGWQLTPDPSPKGIWGSKDAFNYLQFINAESDRLIEEGISSEAAFTQSGRKAIYDKWTALISYEAPQVFLYGQKTADVFNKRVKGITVDWSGIRFDRCNEWSISKK